MAGFKNDKGRRRKDIWKKTNGVCAHCGKAASPQNQTVDHFIPRSWGGTFDKRNLVPLCVDCNRSRKSRSIDPEVYYSYAPQWVIHECRQYKRKFERNLNRYMIERIAG